MFPRLDSNKKQVICIAATQGLISAKLDAVSVATAMDKLGFETLIVIDNVEESKWVSRILNERNVKHQITYNLSDVQKLLDTLKEGVNDILITISGHGYTRGNKSNYFIFGRSNIDRHILRKWFYGFENSRNQLIILIDTCHSQNMLGFQSQGLGYQDGCQRFNPLCISGCKESESLMEDISNEYGYGGGLTCAFLDAIGDQKQFNVKDVANLCKIRIYKLGSTTIFTTALNPNIKQANTSQDTLEFIDAKRPYKTQRNSIYKFIPIIILSCIIYFCLGR